MLKITNNNIKPIEIKIVPCVQILSLGFITILLSSCAAMTPEQRQNHAKVSQFRDGQGAVPSAAKSTVDVFSMDKAISIAQSPTPHAKAMAYRRNEKIGPIKNYAIDYFRFAESANKLWLIKGDGYSDIKEKRCFTKIDGISLLMTSGTSELWNRHGRQDVDKLHSVSESQIFWIGECENGKANGQGIIGWFYIGKINSNETAGFVRVITFMQNGIPSNEVFAYSNSDTCFNTCTSRNYKNKLLGTLRDGELTLNTTSQDTQKQANEANNAMGAIAGIVINKAAEIIKEGANNSLSESRTPSSSGSTKAAGVASIRSETFDNAGRKTEGYWVECQGGKKTRVYRSAWDSSKDWFSPNGLGTKNFIAKESISINDVAKNICR